MALALILVVLIIALTFAYGSLVGAPWFPTRAVDVSSFLELAQLRPGEIFYDLGCGDGRLLAAASQAGATAIGLEVSLLPLGLAWWRKLRQARTATGSMRLRFRDFWASDFKDADVVYFF